MNTKRHPEDSSSLLLSSVVIVAAIFVGLLAGTDAGWRLLLLMLVALAGPILILLTRGAQDRHGRLLPWAFALMFASTGVQQVLHVPVGYLIELTIFSMTFAILTALWRETSKDRWLAVMLTCWFAYLALSILSTLLGRSHSLPAIWQFQYNLKLPLMFGLGGLIVWSSSAELNLRRLLAFGWIFLFGCVGLEIAWAGGHALLFGPPPDLHRNPLIGFGLRYRGPFQHSGYLAIIAGFMACAAIAQFIAGQGRRWLIVSAIYLLLVLLSGQRQEALAVVLALVFFGLLSARRFWPIILVGSFFTLAIAVVVVLQLDDLPIRAILAQWGLVDSTSSLSERGILTAKGLQIAHSYFPLGAGLGTYGGAGAQKFDQSLFIELGFMRFWWFRQGMFLVDTFWPNAIAESGYIATAFLLLAFVVLWLGLLRRCLNTLPLGKDYALCLTGFAAATLLLANSPTSAVLTDPRGSVLLWLLIGMAWRACAPVSLPKRAFSNSAAG